VAAVKVTVPRLLAAAGLLIFQMARMKAALTVEVAAQSHLNGTTTLLWMLGSPCLKNSWATAVMLWAMSRVTKRTITIDASYAA
jgi:hypothetical protein